MAGFGWQLVQRVTEASFRHSADVLVAFVHWKLLTKGLRSVGNGENFSVGADEALSELLPDAWNDGEVYSIRYRRVDNTTDKFLLKVIKADANVIVNLVRISDEKCTTSTLPIQSFVSENQKSIIDNDGLGKKLDEELLDDFFKAEASSSKKPTAEATPTPSHAPPRRDPLMVSEPRRPLVPPYGADDLDPLGRGGGGMLFPPPGMPRGGGFPMPNFDPFHPHMPHPGLPRSGGPGHRRFGDDLPPPGHHDMFG